MANRSRSSRIPKAHRVYCLDTFRLGSKNLIAQIDKQLAEALQISSTPREDAEALRTRRKREQDKIRIPNRRGKLVSCRMF